MGFPNNIAILILAAGASSRMGRIKQLLPWEDTTLLGNTIKNAKVSNAGMIVVVLGANAESICNAITETDISSVENPAWQSGLGSSIACGTEFLLKRDNKTNGILIMLADQPLIDVDYLNTMMAAFHPEQERIIATAYKSRAGVPALFSKSYFKKLSKLDDDFGAKKIIGDKNENVLILDPGNKAIDIDTKMEYDKLVHTKS